MQAYHTPTVSCAVNFLAYSFAGGFSICSVCRMVLEVLEVLAYEVQHTVQHPGIHYQGMCTAKHDKATTNTTT